MEVQVDKFIINCDYCGKELILTKKQFDRNRHHFCSNECSINYRKRNQIKCVCPVCGNDFTRKKSQINKLKDPEHATCSKECCYELRKILYKGEGNHQYGLTGMKNNSWKSNERYKDQNGKYTLIRVEDHPFRDKANFVPEHRLIAEKYLLTNENSIEIDGKKYLKPECVVHHIDFNKKNNAVENLYIFENEGMHTLFHNLFKSNRVQSLEDFMEYYKDNYTNKILNYDWLYRAYIAFGLSVNQISKLFNIPYGSIQTEIYKNNLDEMKKRDKNKNELLKLIVEDLQEMSKNLNGTGNIKLKED